MVPFVVTLFKTFVDQASYILYMKYTSILFIVKYCYIILYFYIVFKPFFHAELHQIK